jgi:CheY-like chemotaxis protein
MAKKILVVDDERDMESLFTQKFRNELRNGFLEIHFAFSGEQALEFLSDATSDLVLVLSDINMPGITGLELLRIIKDKFPGLKVFIVTAYGDDMNQTRAISFGADDFIPKPIDFNLLREKIVSA